MSPFLRPKPARAAGTQPLEGRIAPERVAGQLVGGRRLVVTDRWSTGVRVMTALRQRLVRPPDDAPYADKQAHRAAWREATERLLAPVTMGQIALASAPQISLLADLYPQTDPVLLPVQALQRLERASRIYTEGVHLAVLGGRLHPFWGTYVPTRTDHLELFATWLSSWDLPRSRAVDVGTGSGILAFLLAKSGFGEVLATDNNPNALESVRRDLARWPKTPPIRTWRGDLLPDDGPPADLIVFNPPWLVGAVHNPLDAALYTEEPDLLARFVTRALPRLTAQGRLVVIFSNLVELVQPERPHPVKALIEAGQVRLVQVQRRRAKAGTTRDGRRRRTREKVEVWELAAP